MLQNKLCRMTGWYNAPQAWIPAAIFLCLFIAYLPLTQGYFLVSRDYWGFIYEHSTFLNKITFNAEGDTGSYGRPLAGYVMGFFHFLIFTIDSANSVRCVLILLLAFAAYLFHRWLRIHNTTPINAALISVAIFTLPPFQSNAASISQAPVVLGILLSMAAGLFLHYSLTALSNTVRFFYSSLAIILLFLSLITYPLSTMFIWVMVAVLIGKLEILTVIERRVQILLCFCIPGIAIGIFFIFFRLTQNVLSATEVSFHPITRLQWFIDKPFSVALNLWNIQAPNPTSFWVGVVLFLGLILAIAADISRSSGVTRFTLIKYACLKYFLLISLLPLSVLPMMVAVNYNFLSYRHLSALSPLIFLFFIGATAHIVVFLPKKTKAAVLTTGLAVMCLYGIWSAHDNVQNNVVVPMSAELKYFKKILSQYEPADIKRVHVIASTERHRTLLANYEEFAGFQSALGIPYDGAFNPALVMTAIKELAREDNRFAAVRKDWNIGRAVDVVTYSTKENMEKQKIVFDLKNTVVIDMTQIEFLVNSGVLQKNNRLTPSTKSDTTTIAVLDQCTGGTAISGGDYPGFPAFQAFDDDSISTRWASKQTGLENSGVAYIGYDFGNGVKKHIRQLHLRQGGAITSVKVQQSDDGSLWRDVATLSLQADNNTYLHDLPPSQASRFWRLLANENTGEGPSAWSVYEIEMMEGL